MTARTRRSSPRAGSTRWRAAHVDGDGADGSTNWTAGSRLGRPPTQRIDYVLAPPGSTVEECRVLAEAERFDEFAGFSDHLPLAADDPPS